MVHRFGLGSTILLTIKLISTNAQQILYVVKGMFVEMFGEALVIHTASSSHYPYLKNIENIRARIRKIESQAERDCAGSMGSDILYSNTAASVSQTEIQCLRKVFSPP